MSILKLFCPQCHAALTAPRAVTPGKRVRCPRCSTSFAATEPSTLHVRNGSLGFPLSRPVAVENPVHAKEEMVSGGSRLARSLAIIAAGILVLTIGVGLAIYCFTPPAPPVHAAIRSVAIRVAPMPSPTPASVAPPPAPVSVTPPPASVPTSLAAPAASPPPVPPALRSLPAAEQKKVNDAIDRAVTWLKATQQPTGSWSANFYLTGYAALPGLTLLECSVPPTHPVVQKVATLVRANGPGLSRTYEISLAILFLQRLGNPADQELIRSLALRLVAGQTTAGGWSYQCPVLSKNDEDVLYSLLGGLSYQTYLDANDSGPDKLNPLPLDALPENLIHLAVLQPPKDIEANVTRTAMDDNSNTQVAVLALWAARRQHLPLARPLALIYRRFRGTQQPGGSWCYRDGKYVLRWPSMTCSGLLGLAVGHGLIAEGPHAGEPGKDFAIDQALAVLGKSMEPVLSPHEKCPPLYYLWSLERVGALYNLPTISGRNWYSWGERLLLDNQQANGPWEVGGYPGSSPTIDTCFALLFLKRVNLVQDLTDKLRMAIDVH